MAPVDMGYLKESIDFIFKNDGLTGIVSVGAGMPYTLSMALVFMRQVRVAVVLRRYLGLIKMMMANGIQHMVAQHNLLGTCNR